MTNDSDKVTVYIIESADVHRGLISSDWATVEMALDERPLRPGERVVRITSETVAKPTDHELFLSPIDDDEDIVVNVFEHRVGCESKGMRAEAEVSADCTCGWSSEHVTIEMLPTAPDPFEWDGELPDSFSLECPDCEATAECSSFFVEGMARWEHQTADGGRDDIVAQIQRSH